MFKCQCSSALGMCLIVLCVFPVALWCVSNVFGMLQNCSCVCPVVFFVCLFVLGVCPIILGVCLFDVSVFLIVLVFHVVLCMFPIVLGLSVHLFLVYVYSSLFMSICYLYVTNCSWACV
jgi:hypothetical protein